jgi:hypothetical protein
MNYTRPNNLEHEDTPMDWLNSSLIFSRALGLILKNEEGIVVGLKGDAEFLPDPEVKKVIVFRDGEMISIAPCEHDIEEGQWILLDQEK